MDWVREKNARRHFWKHRESNLNMPSWLDIVYRNCLGGNGIIHDQSQHETE